MTSSSLTSEPSHASTRWKSIPEPPFNFKKYSNFSGWRFRLMTKFSIEDADSTETSASRPRTNGKAANATISDG
jgi:hypothetical protein